MLSLFGVGFYSGLIRRACMLTITIITFFKSFWCFASIPHDSAFFSLFLNGLSGFLVFTILSLLNYHLVFFSLYVFSFCCMFLT